MNGVRHTRERFARVRGRGEVALIPYFIAGYPNWRDSREHLWEAYEAGVNLIELGIPFSDPVADGPTIADASHAALERGVTPRKCLQFVRGLRREGFDLPIFGMTYANLLFGPGYEATADAWSEAGLDGAIVPDMVLEDAREFRRAFQSRGLATTFFVAPSTETSRIPSILKASTGFTYLVAAYGTTGARKELDPAALALLARARRARRGHHPPLCIGFGVSQPAHVKTLKANGADGVIVGSALVRAIEARRNVRRFLVGLKRPSRADG